MKRKELVFDHSVSKCEWAILLIFKVSEHLNVKWPNVTQKIFVNVVVAESARPILWLIGFKEYAVLELLGNLYQLKLPDVCVTATSQLS